MRRRRAAGGGAGRRTQHRRSGQAAAMGTKHATRRRGWCTRVASGGRIRNPIEARADAVADGTRCVRATNKSGLTAAPVRAPLGRQLAQRKAAAPPPPAARVKRVRRWTPLEGGMVAIIAGNLPPWDSAWTRKKYKRNKAEETSYHASRLPLLPLSTCSVGGLNRPPRASHAESLRQQRYSLPSRRCPPSGSPSPPSPRSQTQRNQSANKQWPP